VKYLSGAVGENKSRDIDDSDMFGNIELPVEEKIVFNKFDLVEDDNDEQDAHDAKVGDIFRPGKDKFHRKLNYLIHDKRDLRAALNVLETEMREERVQPEQHHFRILIHACAKVGHCEKAFRLYNSFKKRLLKRHVGIYTDLFHSCTNCPDPQYALTQAHWLRRKLTEDHFIPSFVLYNSMIQAFGRTGDLETAFELLDEMRQNEVTINHITFDFLLQGCISDKENGFRHALMTWRTMRKKQIWPRIHNYNLMLRAAEECRLGDISHSRDIILACLPIHEKDELLRKEENKKKYQKAKKESDVVRDIEDRGKPVLEIVPREEIDTDVVPFTELPNLLSKRPDVDPNILGLSPQDTPQSRLMLMGGTTGLVELMKWDRVQPNIKTFDQLLRIIPNTEEDEAQLISLMKAHNIKPDVSFCNQVLILRETRGDLKLAKQTLDWMAELEIKPDVMTFGALARCCKEPASVFEFLKDCHHLDVRLNSAIMTTLVTNMAIKLEPRAVKRLLEKVMHENIKVDKKMLFSVERFFQTYRSHVKRKEMGLKVPQPVHFEYLHNKWENWIDFVNFYNKKWLLQVRPDLSRSLDQYKSLKDVKDEEYNATHDKPL